MGVDVEQFCGTSVSLDTTLCESQSLFDVGFHRLIERQEGVGTVERVVGLVLQQFRCAKSERVCMAVNF
jgi:hypothetical protein